MLQPGDGNQGTLTLRHCTVVATTPQAGATVLVYSPDIPGTNLILENCVLSLDGSNVGVLDGGHPEHVTVNAGTNLLYVGAGAADGSDLPGTVIMADPNLEADNIHLADPSKADGAGVDIGIATDIDGQSRPWPSGSDPDLGADETDRVPVEISEFMME